MSDLPFNNTPSDPSLLDLLVRFRTQTLLSLFCHHIGTIDSFDAATQTASVEIAYSKTFFEFDSKTKQYVPKEKDYTAIIDAPVIILQGGTGALTFPIQKGDECLLLFNDRDIDNWRAAGAGSPVKTTRLHSYSDAFVLVGLNNASRLIQNYDTTRTVLRKGNAYVGVGDTLVKIANNTTTMLTLLDGLIDVIKNIVTTGSAATQTVSPASQLALQNYKTTLAGLLE